MPHGMGPLWSNGMVSTHECPVLIETRIRIVWFLRTVCALVMMSSHMPMLWFRFSGGAGGAFRVRYCRGVRVCTPGVASGSHATSSVDPVRCTCISMCVLEYSNYASSPTSARASCVLFLLFRLCTLVRWNDTIRKHRNILCALPWCSVMHVKPFTNPDLIDNTIEQRPSVPLPASDQRPV